MKDIEEQMKALDDFVSRARSQNAQHHDSHVASLQGLSTNVNTSYSNISSHFTSTCERVRNIGTEMSAQTSSIQDSLAPLDLLLGQPLAELRSNVSKTIIQEYHSTGETPQKIQYQYATELPHTETHKALLANLRCPISPSKQTTLIPVVFNDAPGDEMPLNPTASPLERRPTSGLREIDVNISSTGSLIPDFHQNTSLHPLSSSGKVVKPSTACGEKENGSLPQIPSFKRSMSGKLPMAVQRSGGKRNTVAVEGRENMLPAQGTFSQSVGAGGRRRSPRTAGS